MLFNVYGVRVTVTQKTVKAIESKPRRCKGERFRCPLYSVGYRLICYSDSGDRLFRIQMIFPLLLSKQKKGRFSMPIPTPHIEAKSPDEIANTVLMPGDPLRAKFIAETYLEDVTQFNQVRGMLGFTGYYKGKRVSVMGSGMGIPSAVIYYHELFAFYEVDTIIRIGTAGAMQANIALRDIVIATASNTDSNLNSGLFGPYTFCPTPDFDLMIEAYERAKELGICVHAGTVCSSDLFYRELDSGVTERLQQYGALAVEMESAGLYMTARKLGKRALAMFTVSDSLVTHEAESAQARQEAYRHMMELGLEIAPA